VARGGLLIWNDCRADGLPDYERWYREEHLPERVGIPGYRYGARYEALAEEASPRFFTLYEAASPEVFLSPAYRDRLGAPSAWTQRVMPHFFNMSRTVCRLTGRAGLALSGTAVSLASDDPAGLVECAAGALGEEGCLGWSLWQAVAEPGADTAEQALRGGPDRRIEACLLLQLGRPEEAAAWKARLAPEGATGSYRLVSLMRADEVRR